jgi:hypothetical protein
VRRGNERPDVLGWLGIRHRPNTDSMAWLRISRSSGVIELMFRALRFSRKHAEDRREGEHTTLTRWRGRFGSHSRAHSVGETQAGIPSEQTLSGQPARGSDQSSHGRTHSIVDWLNEREGILTQRNTRAGPCARSCHQDRNRSSSNPNPLLEILASFPLASRPDSSAKRC